MKRRQFISLWLCVALFGLVLLRVLGRAVWGYLGLASEWAAEDSIPKDMVFSILASEAKFNWMTVILVGIGFAFLLVTVASIKCERD